MQQAQASATTTMWNDADVALIDTRAIPEIPVIVDVAPLIPGIDLWDYWPVCDESGAIAAFDGRSLWMMLSAPYADDPALRHDVARLRLIAHDEAGWHDMGNLLPDGFSPGSREWAGCAVVDASYRVTLYFTASGRRGEAFSFEQRMFATRGQWQSDSGTLTGWSPPVELVASDGDRYVDTRTTQGGPGLIKGFRDPAWLRDPADGRDYIVFAGSDGRSPKSHNGVVGMAAREGDVWSLRPPILSGDGLNNEFERPHILVRDGLYYLFWSTQRHVFAPGGPSGPNGLYGMVADRIDGPYAPLNGTGLVAANPAAEPFQGYSWLVLDTLEVISFIDLWGMKGHRVEHEPSLARSQFGGTPAPNFRIALEGDRATIV